MLRPRFQEDLKNAMQTKDDTAVGTIRLILAALKDRDIAARSKGNYDGIGDDEILSLLQTMIKQRNESVAMYEKGGRGELAAREREEITVIERFMPARLSDADIDVAIRDSITSVGAAGIKDMGKVIADLKSKYAGQMDFAAVSGRVKDVLATF